MSFQDVTKYENLLREGEKSCNGGRWKSRNQIFEINILRNTSRNRKRLLNGTFKYRRTHDFALRERGKWRHIQSHHISDRQVQKAFCKYELLPATENKILPNNAASQVNKGTDYMIRQFRADLSHAYRVCKGRHFYVFVYDFHNYFGSIPHEQSLREIGQSLSDDQSRKMLHEYADIFSGEVGYGIGGEPSQVIAVTYPASIDRMIACNPDVLGSGRYMDDGYAITKTLEAAHKVEQDFIAAAQRKGLVVNEKRMQIYNMEKDVITFLKKRTSMTESGKIIMRLTRENIRDEIRRIKYQKKEYDAGRMPMESIEQSIECWSAYAVKYQSYKARVRVLDCYAKTFGIPWENVRKYLKKRKRKK